MRRRREANTGANSACLAPGRCATTFPSPAGLASSFNRTLWRAKGAALSTEVRALVNAGGRRGSDFNAQLGTNSWGPNINLVRDPRFGRNSELPSEDPLLSGSYAVEMVRGLQGGEDPRYVKVQASLKHYTAYSVESGREGFDGSVSAYDLHDSFLRQFEMGFVQGNASGAMCSFASVNGVPSCASGYLLNDLVRGTWRRPDALIVSDCEALSNMFSDAGNHFAASELDAAVKSLSAGLDLEVGVAFRHQLPNAVRQGLVRSSTLDAALTRVLRKRFETGLFDPLEGQVYAAISPESLNASSHWALNLEAARQSLVLLKNERGTLPLRAGGRVAVIGPHADYPRGLFTDYYGDQVCYSENPAVHDFSCVESIGAAVARWNAVAGDSAETAIAAGVSVDSNDTSGVSAALAAVRAADHVVLCLGTDTATVEHEGIDRSRMGLPGVQAALARQVLAAAKALAKRVVVVFVHGGAVAIDEVLDAADAVVDAFFPGHRGAEALAGALFGGSNSWGRLPISIYGEGYADELNMSSMAIAPLVPGDVGRTYRYYRGEYLLRPFGYGLSYTAWRLELVGPAALRLVGREPAEIRLRVTNTGPVPGTAVVLAAFRPPAGLRGGAGSRALLRQLLDFGSAALAPGGSAELGFRVSADDLQLVSDAGMRRVVPGTYEVVFSDGSQGLDGGPVVSVTVTDSPTAALLVV